MPIALHRCVIQMSIAIAHHDAVSFDHQPPSRRVVLFLWRLMRLVDVLHRPPLAPFQFGSDVFGVRTQAFTAHLYAS